MKIRNTIFCLILSFCFESTIFGTAYQGKIEPLFLPQNQDIIYKKLTTLLDQAKKQVLVAVYWITDDYIVDKLVSLKMKGIDVRVIFDWSTDTNYELLDALIENNIIPIISPGDNYGRMHNKFIAIDNHLVWTGSANLTKTVLAPSPTFSNDENIVVIDSYEINLQYRDAFFKIQNELFDFYLQSIAENEIPDWLNKLLPKLYSNYPSFEKYVSEALKQFKPTKRNNIKSYLSQFSPKSSFQEEKATPRQQEILKSHGIYPNISKEKAFQIIGSLMSSTKKPKIKTHLYEPATPKQKNFLKNHGFNPNISKSKASKTINDIINANY